MFLVHFLDFCYLIIEYFLELVSWSLIIF